MDIYSQNEFISYFDSLSKNNTRDWFQSNKKEHEKFVKNPFKSFIDKRIIHLKDIDPEISIFSNLVRDKRFVNHFGNLLGEKNKIIPQELKKMFQIESLTAN